MTIWEPDTCDCFVDIEKDIIIKKCNIHNSASEVHAHCRSFNFKYGNNPTDRQIDLIGEDKRIEKIRIRTGVNPPKIQPIISNKKWWEFWK